MKKWYFRERNYRTLRESVIPTKKHLKRCFLSNGARYCAIIGLMSMNILKTWVGKLSYLVPAVDMKSNLSRHNVK